MWTPILSFLFGRLLHQGCGAVRQAVPTGAIFRDRRRNTDNTIKILDIFSYYVGRMYHCIHYWESPAKFVDFVVHQTHWFFPAFFQALSKRKNLVPNKGNIIHLLKFRKYYPVQSRTTCIYVKKILYININRIKSSSKDVKVIWNIFSNNFVVRDIFLWKALRLRVIRLKCYRKWNAFPGPGILGRLNFVELFSEWRFVPGNGCPARG